MLQWLLFGIGSIGILWLSLGSLRSWRAHGFYRFFVFEALLGLVVLNAMVWFRDPFSLRQVVSWLLLLISLGLAVHGFGLLRRIGRPDRNIEDPTRLSVEKTTQLVTSGAYRYIRHPLYASLLALGWGVFLKGPEFLSLALVAVVTVGLYATARVEEVENLSKFGVQYEKYMRESKMFIPFVF